MKLSEAQVARFREEGVLVIEGLDGRLPEERPIELNSPLEKSIRATAGPCGGNTALRSLAESQDGTRSRALSSPTMARPRLQSDFINGLLRQAVAVFTTG